MKWIGKNLILKVLTENMNNKELKTEIRKLEIELDYIEAKEPYNIKYIMELERNIDNLYKQLEELEDETN